MSLTDKKCVPCEGGLPVLSKNEAKELLNNIDNNWHTIENNTKIERKFTFKNFLRAQLFANAVGYVAEAEGHHPDISYGWGYCTITLQTHAINGLHENDFIIAAKIDTLCP